MIKGLSQKLRAYLLGGPSQKNEPQADQPNLLIRYFQLIHQQYRTLFILYLGVLVILASLLAVSGFLISSTLDLIKAPGWLFYGLIGLTALLVALVTKAALGLWQLRKKNQTWVAAVISQLIAEVKTPTKTRGFIASRSVSAKKLTDLEQSWDTQPCPHCGEQINLLDEVCPHCQHLLGPPMKN